MKILKTKKNVGQKGFSLIELVLVVITISFLVLLIINLPSSIASVTKSRNASLARDVAGKKIEGLRKLSYANLVNGENSFSDPKLSSLPQPTSIYKIEDCEDTICTEDEEIKKITVKVSWNESGDNKFIELVTLISEGGMMQ